ncbi:MAG: hypothetical protein V4674_04475 [Patescibacteria group bacterium]
MIQIFYGTDREKRNREFHAAHESAVRTFSNPLLLELSAESWDPALLENAVGGSSFLYDGVVVVAKELLAHKEHGAVFLQFLSDLSKSEAHIFVTEEDLSKDLLRALGKLKQPELLFFDLPKKPVVRSTIGFDLGNAVVAREKKRAWLLYEQALREGMAAEELLWPLNWKVKDSITKMRDRSGPLFLQLSGLSRDIVKIYHENKNGGLPIEMAMERLILAL